MSLNGPSRRRPHPHVQIPPRPDSGLASSHRDSTGSATPKRTTSQSSSWAPQFPMPQIPGRTDSSGSSGSMANGDHYLSPTYQSPPQRHSQSLSYTRPASYAAPSDSRDNLTINGHSNGRKSAEFSFPEPQIQRSISVQSSYSARLHAPPSHRHSRSDDGRSDNGRSLGRNISVSSSIAPSPQQWTPEASTEDLPQALSSMTLQSEEGLDYFQTGRLAPSDDEWYRLVPEAATEALGKKEVKRQSVIFEVLKSERDYVQDLMAVHQVFITAISEEDVFTPVELQEFFKEVFWNIEELLSYHQRMLGELFQRQREQHPIIVSLADIILDTVLLERFRPAYESYIKHYPIAEERHRKELKRNKKYQAVLQSVSHDPRLKKRDLVTFISRPVTRLPRLNLILETILKETPEDSEHPDLETMPIINGILSDFIKSTQPGIEAAEDKVKFWSFSEALVYRPGELIEMDFYDDSRTLVYMGPLARRQRNELEWNGWRDLEVALLDNYFVMTSADRRANGVVRYHITSRPIPLEFLRLGSFDEGPDNRKERTDEGGILDSLRYHSKPMYPFTVYHAVAKADKRYTLYATSEAVRQKWYEKLVDALGVHKARHDANKWFAPGSLNDSYFKTRTSTTALLTKTTYTGKVTTAAGFSSNGKRYLIVGCPSGIYVGIRGSATFRRVLKLSNPTSMMALQDFNKLVVLHDGGLLAYSLELMARVSNNEAPQHALEATLERIAGNEGTISFFRACKVSGKMLVVYAAKTFRQTTIHALEALDLSQPITPTRQTNGTLSFRPFGSPFYVPKQASDLTPLSKYLGIATEKNIIIVDPTDLSASAITVAPDFSHASQDDPYSLGLKARCDRAKPLGLAKIDPDEILVIYEEFGCYVDRHGFPKRQSRFVKWETKAYAFAQRGPCILLFSTDFIEIRQAGTSRLVQVIERADIRLLNSGPNPGSTLLVAWRGKKVDPDGNNPSDEISELIETSEIPVSTPPPNRGGEAIWDEWDM